MRPGTVFAGGALAGAFVTLLVAWSAWPSLAAQARVAGADVVASAPASASASASDWRQPSPLAVPREAPVVVPQAPLAASAAPAAVPVTTPAPVAAAVSRPAAADPAVPAATLSAEHAAVLVGRRRPPTLQELHAEFVTQPKHAQHAPTLESSIRQAVTAGNASGEFELIAVDCRTTLCEVLAFGNLPGSGDRWNELTAAMAKQPWYAEHIRNESTTAAVQNNRYVIVTMLQRKR